MTEPTGIEPEASLTISESGSTAATSAPINTSVDPDPIPSLDQADVTPTAGVEPVADQSEVQAQIAAEHARMAAEGTLNPNITTVREFNYTIDFDGSITQVETLNDLFGYLHSVLADAGNQVAGFNTITIKAAR